MSSYSHPIHISIFVPFTFTVETPRHRSCSSHKVTLSAGVGRGIIPSILTEETGLGSADCPWLIRAPVGQKVNLTLHDYGLADKQVRDMLTLVSIVLYMIQPTQPIHCINSPVVYIIHAMNGSLS